MITRNCSIVISSRSLILSCTCDSCDCNKSISSFDSFFIAKLKLYSIAFNALTFCCNVNSCSLIANNCCARADCLVGSIPNFAKAIAFLLLTSAIFLSSVCNPFKSSIVEFISAACCL